MKERIKCTHGYILMQDSCPGCNLMEETPHTAEIVTVFACWSKRPYRRCRQCSMIKSAKVHSR